MVTELAITLLLAVTFLWLFFRIVLTLPHAIAHEAKLSVMPVLGSNCALTGAWELTCYCKQRCEKMVLPCWPKRFRAIWIIDK
ncbi:MAG: hypothetical protein BRC42_07070 [Cyanobacteria bacterium QS_1_48_34]|nr:MAG: hypothetical protein BRC42_07070 [Cyanobacteria bacterium QS_1_48_34]